ncbi:dynein regulatory complex protein 9 [Cheilinus undulatus]|uniref:dynein regulatory complex protein 9 n=1 Tax=Cheilinus undulatus TaxID=241271 RepID=UPI001BD66A48|nr:dynein regulatory complex protein 9 [Cheilinus undulatus]
MSLSLTQSLRLSSGLQDCSDQLDIVGQTQQISSDRGSAAIQETGRQTMLKRDCQFISLHISKLCTELEEKNKFISLQQLVEEDEKAESIRREEKNIIQQEKVHLRREKEESQHKAEELKDVCQLAKDLGRQLYEKSIKVARKKAVVAKSTEVQLQQTQKETIQTEQQLEEQLELLQKQIQRKIKIHEEFEAFLQNQNKELKQKLQQWQESENHAKREKEQQCYNVQRKRTIHLDKLMEKKRRFTEMKQVVVEDREKQEELRLQQAEARAAIKLQAWWRGCMVRHGLSGFREQEEKKGKKKEGKIKNKKKKK